MTVRLLHISDIHFGPPHRDVLDGVIAGMIASEGFDALVVSGDITQRAKPEQFVAARSWLASLSVPQVVVPGNHDVPLGALHERFFQPFARYRTYLSETLEPTLKLPGVWVYGMNSAKGWTGKNGVFRPESLARCGEFFASAPADVLRLVVVHHHLLPAPGPLYDPVASGARDAAYAFAAAKVDLIVAGHLHHSFLAHTRDYYPKLSHDTLVLHSGTSMSNRGRAAEHARNSLNVIEWDGATLRIAHCRYDERAAFVPDVRFEFPRRHELAR